MQRAVLRSALFGAVGASWLAAGDVGASWPWVVGADRVELVARIVAIEVPFGAALGALLGASLALGAHALRRLASGADEARRARLAPIPLLVVASPALVAIAWLLFTGARASALPLRPLWIVASALVLHAGVYAALRIGRALLDAAPAMTRRRASAAIAGLLCLHAAIALVDRHVLPGLYQYLHAAATVLAWAVAWLAFAMLHARLRGSAPRMRPALALGAAVAAGAIAVAAIITFHGSSHAVRVALVSPRAPGARSLLLAMAPLVSGGPSPSSTRDRERARRARDARARRTVDGSVLEGAHVLLVTIDALRADHLGAYGYRARPLSPFLDELAASSVLFEQAFAQAPHSSHSLTSLMTSEYVHQRSELGLALPDETLAGVLRGVGYHAAAFYTDGIFHTDGEQLARYRDERFGFGRASHRITSAEAKTDEVLGEVRQIVEVGEPPSLLWAHYFDVHEPYEDTSFGSADVDRYDGEIRNVDRALGRLLRGARAALTRPLVVVVTADHGEEFREHGGVYHGSTLYQEQIRVPLIVHVPGIAPRRVRTPVEVVDVAPTLLGLVGAPVPPSMRGDDLRPLLAGQSFDPGPAFASVSTAHMVVAWPHKLISDLRFGTLQLYDLELDPGERQNLADERTEVVAALRGELDAWIDALLDASDPYVAALQRGRLADRGAAPALAALLTDEEADPTMRAEAARLLAVIPRVNVLGQLRAASASACAEVATEAAITMAWLGASGPREPLYALLQDDDLERRVRAAIGLGRVRDRAGVPVLIDAVSSDSLELRHRLEAIRVLGTLGDPRAVDALTDALDEVHLRRRAVLALGRIGDARALAPLLDLLHDARHSATREITSRALGHLGDGRAVPSLIAAALDEPLPSAAESLVRLGAIGSRVGGVDLAPGLERAGVRACSVAEARREEDYLDHTTCELGTAVLPWSVPDAVRQARAAVVLVRARRVDALDEVEVRLSSGDARIGRVVVDGTWSEHRVPVSPSSLGAAVSIEVEEGARIALDHVLLLPSER